MGPSSYMRSVVDWNIVLWLMTVCASYYCCICYSSCVLHLCFMVYLPFCPSANSERTDLANSGTSSSNESVSSLPVRDINNHNNYAPASPQKSKRGIYQVLRILMAADGQIFRLKTEGVRSKSHTEGLYLLSATMQMLGTQVTLAPWIGHPCLGGVRFSQWWQRRLLSHRYVPRFLGSVGIYPPDYRLLHYRRQ